MTGRDLAYELGSIRDNLGVIEGYAAAMIESIKRELRDDHFSREFLLRFAEATEAVRDSVDRCYAAVEDLPRAGEKSQEEF